MSPRALIAMSGGVDSSVAAHLIAQMGMEVAGVTMKLYTNEDIDAEEDSGCCSLDDTLDAGEVARKLGFRHYVFNYSQQFRDEVIKDFVDSYMAGRTPNPCIVCNKKLKFGSLWDRAKELGYDYIVTGHYARVEERDGRFILRKAIDESKDQSYVLYNFTQEQLAHVILPLGGMQKSQIREIASTLGLVNANKPDSQDICFVPDGDYVKFIERYLGITEQPGDIIDVDGKVLGQHRGALRYTIGQRKGLGFAAGVPMFVIDKNMACNTVTVSSGERLFRDSLIADDFNWVSIKAPTSPIEVSAKIRYKHREQPATCIPREDGSVEVVFKEPQRAITAGQSVVLYDGDVVLGGGIIRS